MRLVLAILLGIVVFTSCEKTIPDPPPIGPPTPVDTPLYFPPAGSTTWESYDPASLGWNAANIPALYNFLDAKGTKAFLVLKHGRIVIERYFGTFTRDSVWYWASAGKTATAMLVGIAQQEGLLNINNRTNQYLGNGWTSLPLAQENQITVRHQLTMTTGLDDNVPESDCTLPSCLQLRAAPGTRWAYHNAPYTLLEKVVANASGRTYNQYYQQKLATPTGMGGVWIQNGYNNVLFSNPRTMARFGLLLLNRGTWGNTPILTDTAYFRAMTNTSQNLNLSYGYLTWLNGKASHMLPIVRSVFNSFLTPTAPADLYAGLGKNDQKVYVVPSQKLVVIRMGESAGAVQLASSSFDTELWTNLRNVIPF
jgi:CubicO group peptidase (beta-lactamase class C family)